MDARDSISGSYDTNASTGAAGSSDYSSEGGMAKVDTFGALGSDTSGQDTYRSTQEIKDQAREKTGEVIDQAKEKTGQVVGQVTDQAKSQIESQKGRAAEGLSSVSQALRQTGQQMRDQQDGATAPIAQYVDKAADQVDKISTFLNEKNLDQMVTEVERYARRQPAIFLGGAVALGLIGARFLKSSAQRGSQMQQGDRGYGYDSYRSNYSAGYGGGYGTGYDSGSGYGSRVGSGSGYTSGGAYSAGSAYDSGAYSGGYNDTAGGGAGGQQTYETQALPTYSREADTNGNTGTTENTGS